MKPVDYDAQQYRNYALGRALRPEQMTQWMRAFADRLPARRPLDGLDSDPAPAASPPRWPIRSAR
jgi:hypothetical protein